jgi:hypothetical protein
MRTEQQAHPHIALSFGVPASNGARGSGMAFHESKHAYLASHKTETEN